MYAYLPEIYPTQLLGTGAGFAWAVGRMVTAALGLCAGPIIAAFHGSYGSAAAVFSLAYLVGLGAALFVQQSATKDRRFAREKLTHPIPPIVSEVVHMTERMR